MTGVCCEDINIFCSIVSGKRKTGKERRNIYLIISSCIDGVVAAGDFPCSHYIRDFPARLDFQQ